MTGFFSKDKGEEVTLSVEGMSCQHCADKVEKGLEEVEGVLSAQVDLAKKEVKVRFEPQKVEVDAIKHKIVDVGYQVI